MLKNPFTMITAFLATVMFRSNIKGNLLDLQKKGRKKLLFSIPTKSFKSCFWVHFVPSSDETTLNITCT